MERDLSQVDPNILEKAIEEVAQEVKSEGQLIRERVGNRSHSKDVKRRIEGCRCHVNSNSSIPRDRSKHTYKHAMPRKGTTSASRVAKG